MKHQTTLAALDFPGQTVYFFNIEKISSKCRKLRRSSFIGDGQFVQGHSLVTVYSIVLFS